MPASFPTPSLNQPNGIRRPAHTRPGTSAFDKFPAVEFDAWIGGLTTRLKGALAFDAQALRVPPPTISRLEGYGTTRPPLPNVNGSREGLGEDSGMEDSFADVRRRREKGKMRDPREGPGLDGKGEKDQPIELLSDEEESGTGEEEEEEEGGVEAGLLEGEGPDQDNSEHYEYDDEDNEHYSLEDDSQRGSSPAYVDDAYYDSNEGSRDPSPQGAHVKSSIRTRRVEDEDGFLTDQILFSDEDEDAIPSANAHNNTLNDDDGSREDSPADLGYEDDYEDDSHRPSDAENIPPPRSGPLFPSHTDEEEEEQRFESPPFARAGEDNENMWDVQSDDEPLRHAPEGDEQVDEGEYEGEGQEYEEDGFVPAPGRRILGDLDNGPHYDTLQRHVHGTGGYEPYAQDAEEDEQEDEEESINSDEEEGPYDAFKLQISSNPPPGAEKSEPKIFEILDSDEEEAQQPSKHAEHREYEDEDEEGSDNAPTPYDRPPAMDEIYGPRPSMSPDPEPFEMQYSSGLPVMHSTAEAEPVAVSESHQQDNEQNREPYLDNSFGFTYSTMPMELQARYEAELEAHASNPLPDEDGVDDVLNNDRERRENLMDIDNVQAVHEALESRFEHKEIVTELPVVQDGLEHFSPTALGPADEGHNQRDAPYPSGDLIVPGLGPEVVDLDLPDPWVGPATYAEDFYSGGDAAIFGLVGGEDASVLTPLPKEDGVSLVLPGHNDNLGGGHVLDGLRYPEPEEGAEGGDDHKYLDYIDPDPVLAGDSAPMQETITISDEVELVVDIKASSVQESTVPADEEPAPVVPAPAADDLDDDELDYMDPEPSPGLKTNAVEDTTPQHTTIPPLADAVTPNVDPAPIAAQTLAERRSTSSTTPSLFSNAFNPAFLASLIPPPTFSPAAVSDKAPVEFSLHPVAPAVPASNAPGGSVADYSGVEGAEGERSTETDASVREWLRDPVRVGATLQEMASGVEDVGPEPEVAMDTTTTVTVKQTVTCEQEVVDYPTETVKATSIASSKPVPSPEGATTPIDTATAEQLAKDAGSPPIEPINPQKAAEIAAAAMTVPGQDALVATPLLVTPEVPDDRLRGIEPSHSQTTAPSESSHNSSNPQLPTPNSNYARPLPEESANGSRTLPFGSHTPANMLLPEFSSHIKAVVAGAPLPHFNFGAQTPPVPRGGLVSPYFVESSGGYFDAQPHAQAQPEQTPDSVEDVEKTPVATVQAAPDLADLLRKRTESFEMLPSGSYPSMVSVALANTATATTIQEEGVSQMSLEEISQAGAIFPSTLSASTNAERAIEEKEEEPSQAVDMDLEEHISVTSMRASPELEATPEVPMIHVEEAEEDKGEVISLAPTPVGETQSLVPDERLEAVAEGFTDEVVQEMEEEAQAELDTPGETLGLDLDGRISSLGVDAPITGLSRTPSLAGLLPVPATPPPQSTDLPTVDEEDKVELVEPERTVEGALADEPLSVPSRDKAPDPAALQLVESLDADAQRSDDEEYFVTPQTPQEPSVVDNASHQDLLTQRSVSPLEEFSVKAETSQALDDLPSPVPVQQSQPSLETVAAVDTIATTRLDDSELIAPAMPRKASRRIRWERRRSRTQSRPLNDGSDADAESDSSDDEARDLGAGRDDDDIKERGPTKRRRMRESPCKEQPSQAAETSLSPEDEDEVSQSGPPVLGSLPSAALSAPALIPAPEEEEDSQDSTPAVNEAEEDGKAEDATAADRPELVITIPESKKATSTAKVDVHDDDDSQDEADITKTLAAETDDDEPATATPTTANASPARPSLNATQTLSLPEVPLAQRGNVYHQHVQKQNNTGVTQLPGRQIGPRRPPPPARIPTLSIPAPITVPSPALTTPSTPSTLSPTLSQDSQAPLSQVSTATHTEPTNARRSGRASRSMAMKSAPVTRSHCKYHKISFELWDGGPRILFVVPGCVLVNTEFMAAEDIVDQGDAEVEDMNRIEAGIDTLDISAEVISNLKLLVGVDVLREIEVFYLPQDDVPIGRKRRKVSRVTDTLSKQNRRRESLASIPRAGPSGVKRKRDEALSASQRFLRGSDDDSASVGRRGSTDGSVRSTPMPTPTPKQLGSRSPNKGKLKVVGTRSPPPAFRLHKSGAVGPSGSQSQRRLAPVQDEADSTVPSEQSSLSSEEADTSGVYVPTPELKTGKSTGSDTSLSGRPSQAKRKRKRKSHLDVARSVDGAGGAKKRVRK